MKNHSFLLIFSFLCLSVRAHNCPFHDTSLSDSARITNLISLMTLDEKINCLSAGPSIS